MRMIMIEVDYQPEFSQKSPRFSIYQFPFAKPPNLFKFSIPLISMTPLLLNFFNLSHR